MISFKIPFIFAVFILIPSIKCIIVICWIFRTYHRFALKRIINGIYVFTIYFAVIRKIPIEYHRNANIRKLYRHRLVTSTCCTAFCTVIVGCGFIYKFTLPQRILIHHNRLVPRHKRFNLEAIKIWISIRPIIPYCKTVFCRIRGANSRNLCFNWRISVLNNLLKFTIIKSRSWFCD